MSEMTLENSRRIGDALRAIAAQMLIIADICNTAPTDEPHDEAPAGGVATPQPEVKVEEQQAKPQPLAHIERGTIPTKEMLDHIVDRVRVAMKDPEMYPKLRVAAGKHGVIPVKTVNEWAGYNGWVDLLNEVGA